MILDKRLMMALLGAALPAGSAGAGLQIGDKAPPLDKVQWIKGEPVQLGKEIYVLEFWATWCGPCIMQIPHVTELQKKYGGQGVRFVGLTSPGFRRQRLEEIKRFVAEKGDKMDYTVGFDPTEQSYENYMAAAGINGIPYAFIVGRDGKIAWHGFPDDQLEGIVKLMVAGKFDADRAKQHAEQRKILDALAMKFNFATRVRDWDKALAALAEMLAVDSANKEGIQLSLQILSQEVKDPERLRSWVETYMQNYAGDPEGLARVAMTLLEMPQLGDRHPDLALAAAEAALAADADSPSALQAQARALHQIGRIAEAVTVQAQAVAAANGSDKLDAQRVLEFYQACERLAKR